MRIIILLLCCLSVLAANKNKKYLTESMGQEVIEIGAPLKELPELEEEPSAENDDENATSTTILVATQKETKIEPVKLTKNDAQKDDEEARIEKELADIYKDSLDYKADSAEVTKESTEANTTEETEKPIARARDSFKFQPDSNNPREVAFFRTSVDEISCRNQKLSGVTEMPSGKGNTVRNLGFYTLILLQFIHM